MKERQGQHLKVNPSALLYDTLNEHKKNALDFMNPYVVFYKGEVIDNQDPEERGRLQLKLFHFDRYVENSDLEWYNPSIMGSMFYLPRQGDIVYVTFEDVENRIGGMWWSYFIREGQWDWRVDEKKLILKVKGGGSSYVMDQTFDEDKEVLMIDTEEHLIKVHSQFILISKDGWEATDMIPEKGFVSFDGNASKVTINVDKTFLGNSGMDMKTYLDIHIDKIHAAISDLADHFEDHKHPGVLPGPPYITTKKIKDPIGSHFPSGYSRGKFDDFKSTTHGNVNKFLTDEEKAK
jgi:hypothetical protein